MTGEQWPGVYLIEQEQYDLAREITTGRLDAHTKHGAQSIEGPATADRMLAILVEEVGEVATEVNDAELGKLKPEVSHERLRAELIDVLTVASAWVSKLDRMHD